jgi:hypothetical protein
MLTVSLTILIKPNQVKTETYITCIYVSGKKQAYAGSIMAIFSEVDNQQKYLRISTCSARIQNLRTVGHLISYRSRIHVGYFMFEAVPCEIVVRFFLVFTGFGPSGFGPAPNLTFLNGDVILYF